MDIFSFKVIQTTSKAMNMNQEYVIFLPNECYFYINRNCVSHLIKLCLSQSLHYLSTARASSCFSNLFLHLHWFQHKAFTYNTHTMTFWTLEYGYPRNYFRQLFYYLGKTQLGGSGSTELKPDIRSLPDVL